MSSESSLQSLNIPGDPRPTISDLAPPFPGMVPNLKTSQDITIRSLDPNGRMKITALLYFELEDSSKVDGSQPENPHVGLHNGISRIGDSAAG